MSITISKPGIFCTIQDLGRHGYQNIGVVVGGAMDEDSHRLANLLVGNDANAATLEMTLGGLQLRCHQDVVIAICGADCAPQVDGVAVPQQRPVLLPAGSEIRFGHCRRGARTYVAFAGGLAVAPVLGSRSTYVRGCFGGVDGRALRADDTLELLPLKRHQRAMVLHLQRNSARWYALARPLPMPGEVVSIRVTMGTHEKLLQQPAQLYAQTYTIHPQSDRMGYRLRGEPLTFVNDAEELLSEGVAFGTVQCPPDGLPIVLMADRQTTGGYPRIAQVIRVDLPLLAQLKSGDSVQFVATTVSEAQQLYIERELQLQQLAQAVRLKVE